MTDVSVADHSEHSHLPSQDRPLWGDLTPGPYVVGYAVAFTSDPARAYDEPLMTDGAPSLCRCARPILVCTWYPAQAGEGRAMR